MATVVLPFGYPLISGAESETIIYQGTLVRSYTLPSDPRSASQLQNRRFLSDFAKMRATAGAFARAAFRSNLGTKWGAILYQYAKADLNSYWSSAVLEWGTFSEAGRDEWRDAAPYLATFNDKGLIFFALLRTAYYAVGNFGVDFFGLEEWGELESADALMWWNLENNIYAPKGIYDMPAYQSTFGIEGTPTNNASALNGSYLEDVETFEFFIYGRTVVFFGRRAPGLGTVRTYFDGEIFSTVDISNAVEVFQYELVGAGPGSNEDRNFKGFHVVKFEVLSGSVNLDFFRVY